MKSLLALTTAVALWAADDIKHDQAHTTLELRAQTGPDSTRNVWMLSDSTNKAEPKFSRGIWLDIRGLKEVQARSTNLMQFDEFIDGNVTMAVTANLITNTTTETRTVTFTNLMLQCVTTNAGGVFTNLVPIMTIGTNVGGVVVPPAENKWNNLQFFTPVNAGGYSDTGAHQ